MKKLAYLALAILLGCLQEFVLAAKTCINLDSSSGITSGDYQYGSANSNQFYIQGAKVRSCASGVCSDCWVNYICQPCGLTVKMTVPEQTTLTTSFNPAFRYIIHHGNIYIRVSTTDEYFINGAAYFGPIEFQVCRGTLCKDALMLNYVPQITAPVISQQYGYDTSDPMASIAIDPFTTSCTNCPDFIFTTTATDSSGDPISDFEVVLDNDSVNSIDDYTLTLRVNGSTIPTGELNVSIQAQFVGYTSLQGATTSFTIYVANCDFELTEITSAQTTLKLLIKDDDGVAFDQSIKFSDFKQFSPEVEHFCSISSYIIECSDPEQDEYHTENKVPTIQTSSKCQKFEYGAVAADGIYGQDGVRIRETSYVSPGLEYEGAYTIKMSALNVRERHMSHVSLQIQIRGDCDQEEITYEDATFDASFAGFTFQIEPPTVPSTESTIHPAFESGTSHFKSKDLWYWQGQTKSFLLDFQNTHVFSCPMVLEMIARDTAVTEPEFMSFIEEQISNRKQYTIEMIAKPRKKYSQNERQFAINVSFEDFNTTKQPVEVEFTLLIWDDCYNPSDDPLTEDNILEYDKFETALQSTYQLGSGQNRVLMFLPEPKFNGDFVDLSDSPCPIEKKFVTNLLEPLEAITFDYNGRTEEMKVMQIEAIAKKNLQIETTECKLSQFGQEDCTVEYSVQLSSINGTVATQASGVIKFINECKMIQNELWIMPDNFTKYYELRQDPVQYDLPYMSLKLPSQDDPDEDYSDDYPIEVCGDLIYRFEIEIDRESLNFQYDDTTQSAFFENNDSRGINITQVDTKTIESGYLKVETNNYEYSTKNTCLGPSPDQDCVYETSYKFKISAQFEYWSDLLDPQTFNSQFDFTIGDPCLEIYYSEKPNLRIDGENPHFNITQPTLEGSGQSLEDPWIFNLTRHLMTEMDIFEMDYIHYKKSNEVNQDVGCNSAQFPDQQVLTYLPIEYSWSETPTWLSGYEILYQPIAQTEKEFGIKFFFEASERFMIGNHQVVYEIKLANEEIEDAPMRYVKFNIEILDCKVENLFNIETYFQSSALTINEEIVYPFDNYIQEPKCDFDVEYTIALLAISSQSFPTLNSSNKNENTSPKFVFLDIEARTLSIKPIQTDLIGEKFAVFITGTVMVNNTIQDPVETYNQGNQTIEILRPNVGYVNTPPKIQNFVKTLSVKPGELRTYTIGLPYDLQFDDFYVSEWGFTDIPLEEDQPTWIQFKNITISEGLKFNIEPQVDDQNTQYSIFIILTDSGDSKPLSETFKFKVKVLKADDDQPFLKKQIISDEKEAKKELVVVTIEPPDIEGNLWIKFNKKIRQPSNITSWNSQNEGADRIFTKYQPAEETETIMYDQDVLISMSWYVVKVNEKKYRRLQGAIDSVRNETSELIETDQIQIKLNFTEPSLVSRKAKDTLLIQVQDEMFSLETRYQLPQANESDTTIESNLSKNFFLPQQQPVGLVETVAALTGSMENVLLAFLGANMIVSLFSAYLLQHLWGMINTLQIIVLTSLFGLDLPYNSSIVMQMILKMCALEAVDTSSVLNIFNFRETNPFQSELDSNGEEVSKYADAGYESLNFFELLCVILLMILFFGLYVLVKWLFTKILSCCGDNCLTRRVRAKIEFTVVILRFLLEGCIQIGMSAMICVLSIEKENFEQIWEAVSTVFAFLGLLILLIAPIYFYKISQRHINEVQNNNAEEQPNIRYAVLFEDYRQKQIPLRYPSIFFIRRYALIFVLTYFPNGKIVQITCQIYSTMYVVSFLASVKPFASPFSNTQELINELTVWFAAYPLFFFTDYCWMQQMRLDVGWSLIACVVLNIVFNGYRKCRRRWLRHKQRNEIARRQAERLLKEEQAKLKEEEAKKNELQAIRDREEKLKHIESLFLNATEDRLVEKRKLIVLKTKPLTLQKPEQNSELVISLDEIAKIDAAGPLYNYEDLNFEEMIPPKNITPVVYDNTNDPQMIEAEEMFKQMYPKLYKGAAIKEQQAPSVEEGEQEPPKCYDYASLERYLEAQEEAKRQASLVDAKVIKPKNKKKKAKAKKGRAE